MSINLLPVKDSPNTVNCLPDTEQTTLSNFSAPSTVTVSIVVRRGTGVRGTGTVVFEGDSVDAIRLMTRVKEWQKKSLLEVVEYERTRYGRAD